MREVNRMDDTSSEEEDLIADAKVPLLWLRNKELRTQPYVQTRILQTF